MVRIESVVRDREPLLTCVFHAASGHHSLKKSALATYPSRGRKAAQRRSGALVNYLLETHSPTLFHTASALSAPSGHLPLEGKALCRGYRYPHIFCLTANEKDFSLSLEMTIRGKEVFSYTAILHDH